MVEAELKTRQQKFQQVLDGASDMFLMWAAHRFYVEAKERFIAVPWDENPAAVYSKTPPQPSTAPLVNPCAEATPATFTITSPAFGAPTVNLPEGFANPDIIPQAPGMMLDKMNKMYGTKYIKWVPVGEAPIVKKKAYNPISMHMKTGQYVMYETVEWATKKKVMRYAKILGFTKFLVKLSVFSAGFPKTQANYAAIKMVSC